MNYEVTDTTEVDLVIAQSSTQIFQITFYQILMNKCCKILLIWESGEKLPGYGLPRNAQGDCGEETLLGDFNASLQKFFE